MRAIRTFLIFWLVAILFSAAVMLLDGGFSAGTNWAAVAIVTWFFAIPALGVAFVQPFLARFSKCGFVSVFATIFLVGTTTFISGSVYVKQLGEKVGIEIPIMQTLMVISFFLTELFLSRIRISPKNKVYRFELTSKFAIRLLFWIVLPEFVLLSFLLAPEFETQTRMSGYSGFLLWMFAFSVLTNSAALFGIWIASRIGFLAQRPFLGVFFATFLAISVGFFVACIKIQMVESRIVGILMTLLFPALFSASAMLFLVRQKVESDAKDSLIKKLGKSFNKKQSEYESLKRQVNPHFFFNNLNMLLSFVESDPQKALEFGRRLSNVYRKFLNKEDEDFVALADEMAFITEYLEIYRAKFATAFSQKIEVDANSRDFILADSLQEIVDNIFKHNIVEDENQLLIEIFTEDRNLIVRNSVIAKKGVNSNGIGLENIKKRYELLTDQTFSVSKNEDFFVVSLPILSVE
ncbi:histidine kinase [Flavobacterium sp.]|uniref:sensor histidine kinase n=1 Tax=Flavobacterium sp. TaxID=239 RepID=UPI0011FA5AE1|nr:histidine kinase [Flavobacterium sp.]RZJ71117.1 MAG: hypothetical protein EOO49_11745 [Flavobacterium sp.]